MIKACVVSLTNSPYKYKKECKEKGKEKMRADNNQEQISSDSYFPTIW